MILEAIFNFGLWLFDLIFSAMPSSAPVLYSVASTVEELAGFGIWVIGEDMWFTLINTMLGWLVFKMTWGIILFIYRLIPLT